MTLTGKGRCPPDPADHLCGREGPGSVTVLDNPYTAVTQSVSDRALPKLDPLPHQQRDERDVRRHDKLVGKMPTGLVEDEHDVRTGGTAIAISARCRVIAAMLQRGNKRAAPLPSLGVDPGHEDRRPRTRLTVIAAAKVSLVARIAFRPSNGMMPSTLRSYALANDGNPKCPVVNLGKTS
jgi:hypothetical protein